MPSRSRSGSCSRRRCSPGSPAARWRSPRAYSNERVQFGKQIGAFQGIAHPLADSATDVDGARLLVWWAIWANATGRPDASAPSAMAWWWAGRAAEPAVLRAVHTFGGYGVSLEYDVQLYFRRASW